MGKKKKKNNKKAKRISKQKSPYKITVKNWEVEPYSAEFQKEIQINENANVEITIDGSVYIVSINKKNKCLNFTTKEQHLYLQPISITSFLIKANSKLQQNEN